MKRLHWIALLTAAMVLATGCARGDDEPEAGIEEVSIREAVTEADPQAAVNEIYATLPDARTQVLTQLHFQNLFPDLGDVVEAYYGCTSDPGGWLSDVIIFQPGEGTGESGRSNRDIAHDALRLYQEQRVREFENYDILDAFTIASKAEVYVQGNYVILLMLPEDKMEEARRIIDSYIPL